MFTTDFFHCCHKHTAPLGLFLSTLWECTPSHVHDVLNRLLGQQSEDERKKQLFRGMTLPGDLEFLWEKFDS